MPPRDRVSTCKRSVPTPDSATLGGIPLADAASRASVPSVVPSDVPNLGLRRVGENTRIVALLAMVVLGFIAVFAHPRPGRSLRGLGWAVALVCGAWLVGLLIVGWVIGFTSQTLFGEMIDAVWSDAVPSMLLLVSAGAIIGVGLWIAGTAFDGFDSERARRSGATFGVNESFRAHVPSPRSGHVQGHVRAGSCR